jgi:2-oxo-4-hydroxy-4-carboxy-5-ureidoimidazoline decarboxylase
MMYCLAVINSRYLGHFGFIFIVCTNGKSSEEMLELLEARIDNDPDREISIAAAEQAKITRLRLARLPEALARADRAHPERPEA